MEGGVWQTHQVPIRVDGLRTPSYVETRRVLSETDILTLYCHQIFLAYIKVPCTEST